MPAPDSLTYCLAEVRRHDRDRYLTALFAPAVARPALWPLYAFNLEVAKTREAVSEPILGRIRLEWWREALDGIYAGTPRQHPVVLALNEAVARYDLSRARLERLIDAREVDLDDAPPRDLAALTAYAEGTAGTLQELVMEALGRRDDPALDAARAIGSAWALVGLIRAVAFHAQAQRQYLPEGLMTELGATLTPSAELSAVVERIAAEAARRLAAGRAVRGLPQAVKRGLLVATLADADLADIRRAGNDPFALPTSPGRPWRLALAATLGRY